jgi:hypothetical protein
MTSLFHRKPYAIKRKAHRVYVRSRKPIQEWTPREMDAYLAGLQKEVRKTVDADVWRLLTGDRGERCEDAEYQSYVRSVRDQLVAEYGLNQDRDEVQIALYHCDMLVIFLLAEEGADLPYYYRGIQLKPIPRKTRHSSAT